MAFDRIVDITVSRTIRIPSMRDPDNPTSTIPGHDEVRLTPLSRVWAEEVDLFQDVETIGVTVGSGTQRVDESRQFRLRYLAEVHDVYRVPFAADEIARSMVLAPRNPLTGAGEDALTVTALTTDGGRGRYLLLDCTRVTGSADDG